MEQEGRTWGADEAAAYLGCTTGTLRVWCSRRRVPFLKVGRLTRFRKRDLDQWLDTRVVSP
ncbi:MAG: helix-turn-helix domain-containing protein [bacterium]|nr:helix-turn-helix domain-containing protein [bacterium]